MNMNARGVAATAVALCLLPFASTEAASRNSADLLQYIPADSPYVLASTKPMPDKVADKLEPAADDIFRIYRSILRQLMAEKLVKMSAEEDSGEGPGQFRDFMEEVFGLMSIEGLRSVGIERDSAFALYGNGLTPVLRLELSDSKLFDAAMGRMEEKSGRALDVAEAGGNSYKYVDIGPARLIIATLESQLIVTAVPSQFDEVQVSLALGIDKPRKSIRKSKTLDKINKEYGFSKFMTGYFDNVRIAQIFTGGATGLDKELFAATGFETPELSAVCKAETMQMVDVAPRIVVGYDTLTTDRIDSKLIIEMREDIAAGLATLPAAVPGLGQDPGGLMSFGFSLNPLKAKEFYEARVEAMEADPFECESFASLQESAAKGRVALNQPFSPVVYSLRGFVANVLDVKGMNLSDNQPPESVDATILFAVENAESLIMMAAMADPQFAALNLVPDGNAVPFEMARIAMLAEQAFVALSENALSISLGEGAEANAEDILVADSTDPAPFLSISLDSARYYSMIGDAMMLQEPGDTSDVPLPMRESLRDLMIASGSVYERVLANILFTAQGIVIEGRTILAD